MLRQGTKRGGTRISNCVQILPFFATKSWISEQVVRVIAFRCHPILVISPSDTVQFIDQVWKPTHTMACLGAGIRCCISWYIWPLIRVRWKREWCMWIFAVLQTSRGTGKMSLAAFRWRAVDLELVKLMHFWFAITETRKREMTMWETCFSREVWGYRQFTHPAVLSGNHGQSHPGLQPAQGFVLIVSWQVK